MTRTTSSTGLRAKGGWAPGVLLSEDDHALRYVEAAADQLMEAARAGATFAGGKADEAPGVDDVAASMASEIVAPLRRRLEGAGPSVEEGDESALVELVGAAFREWKGARTERLAGDQTVFAFSRAALAAVPEGHRAAMGRRRRRGGVPGLRRQRAGRVGPVP